MIFEFVPSDGLVAFSNCCDFPDKTTLNWEITSNVAHVTVPDDVLSLKIINTITILTKLKKRKSLKQKDHGMYCEHKKVCLNLFQLVGDEKLEWMILIL